MNMRILGPGMGVLFCLIAGSAQAATFVVDTLVDESDGDFSAGDFSLREAVEQANLDVTADLITFDPALTSGGAVSIVLGLGQILVSESLTITGPGQTVLSISGNNASRIFFFDDGDVNTFVDIEISGLSLVNGHAMDAAVPSGNGLRGGAIRSLENFTLTDSTLLANRADTFGGAIYTLLGVVNMDGVTFTGNMALAGDGGGMFFDLGTLTMRNAQFFGNTASASGGGLYVSVFRAADSALIEDVVFQGNTATTGDGGGLFIVGSGDSVVRRNTFDINTAGDDGGGMGRSGGTGLIEDCTVTGNTGADGGGLYLTGGNQRVNETRVSGNFSIGSVRGGGGIFIQASTVLVENTTISGNTATQRFGGGIMKLSGNLTVVNSTVSGNTTNLDGGGIYNQSANAQIINSTIRGNTANDDGGGVARSNGTVSLRNALIVGNSASDLGDEIFGAVTANGNNLFGHSGRTNAQAFDGFTPGASDITATSDGTNPTAEASILDTALADNGGPTLTHALVMGSPAQEAGDNALATDDGTATGNPLTTDQRGFPRIAFATVDIGAVEVVDPAPLNLTDCSAISMVDIGSPAIIPLAGDMDTVDFDVIYNGVTVSGLPAGNFTTVSNVVGNASTVVTRANGFDIMGNPVFDEVVCTLDYNVPAPVCTQDPDSTVTPVDVGTVITLTSTTTNTVSATADGVPMTLVSGTPNTDFSTVWEATHVAVVDTVIDAQSLNPDGDMGGCSWTIDVNRRLTVAVTPTSGLVTTEAGGTATFSVVMDQDPPLDEVTIALSSSDPGEGAVFPPSLTFTPGNYDTPQMVTVTGVDDAVVDGDQPYTIITGPTVSPGDPEFDGVDVADVSVVNADNDTGGISINDVSVTEGTGSNATATFTVTLDTAVDGGFTVGYSTADGSATAPADYSAASGMLTFAGNVGETQTIAVSVIGDSDFEPDETYMVNLGTPSNPGVVATDGTGLGTIIDDDSADLAIDLSAAPDPVIAGTQLVYTAQVSNAGPADAVDVAVSFSLPLGTQFISGNVTGGGSCSGANPVVCSFTGAVLVGAGNARGASITVDVLPSQLLTLAASATVSSSTADANLANNTSSVNTAVATSADLAMAVSIAPTEGTVGDFFTFSATATNLGPSDAADVQILIDVPLGLVIIGANPSSGGTCASGLPASGVVMLTCDYPGATPPGATRSVDVLLQSVASGSIVVTATAASATADPVANNQSASAAIGAAVQVVPTLSTALLALLSLLMAGMGALAVRLRS